MAHLRDRVQHSVIPMEEEYHLCTVCARELALKLKKISKHGKTGQAHNLKVSGSNPDPATNLKGKTLEFLNEIRGFSFYSQ